MAYPTSITSFSTKTLGQTIQPSHVNDLQTEITAIETGLLNGIAHNFIPLTDATYDLGSTSKQFRALNLSATANIGGILNVTGTTNLVGTATIGTIATLRVAGTSVLTGAVSAGATLTAAAQITVNPSASASSAFLLQVGSATKGAIGTRAFWGDGASNDPAFVAAAGLGLYFYTNDSTSPVANFNTSGALTLTKSGGSITEQNRSFAMGATQAVAFNAGNFTANPSNTWTVGSTDQTTFSYSLVGDTATVRIVLTETTYSNGGGTDGLLIALASPYNPAETVDAPVLLSLTGGTVTLGRARVTGSLMTIDVPGATIPTGTTLNVSVVIAYKAS